MYWIRRRTGRDNPIHTSHNQANFLANFKRSLMLTVQLEYLFQAAQDARLVHSRHQVPAVLTFNPATTLGSNIVPDLIHPQAISKPTAAWNLPWVWPSKFQIGANRYMEVISLFHQNSP